MGWEEVVLANFPTASKEAVDEISTILEESGPWGLFQEVEYGGSLASGGGPSWVLEETEVMARQGLEECWEKPNNNYFHVFCGQRSSADREVHTRAGIRHFGYRDASCRESFASGAC